MPKIWMTIEPIPAKDERGEPNRDAERFKLSYFTSSLGFTCHDEITREDAYRLNLAIEHGKKLMRQEFRKLLGVQQ